VNQIIVDVIADPAINAGGHARIRLKGLWLLPPASTFRIEQLDQEGTVEPDWPGGDHNPRAIEVTGDGVELHVGPDIVDSPALQAGTPVRILVPAASIDAEIRWPSLPASVADQAPAVLMTPAQRAAEIERAHRLKQEAEQRAAEAAFAQQREEEATIEAMRIAKVEAERRAAEALSERRRSDDAADAVRRVAEIGRRNSLQPIAGPLARPFPNGTYMNGHANGHASDAATHSRLVGSQSTASASNAVGSNGRLATLSRTRVRTPLISADYPTPSSSALAIPVGSQVRKSSPAARSTTLPILTFCVGLLLPLAAAVIGWKLLGGSLNLQIVQTPAAIPVRADPARADPVGANGATLPAVQITEQVPSATGPTTNSAATSYVSVEDIFTIGAISPRGQSATNVSADAARALADRSLHGVGQPVDREEARFWLRKSLAAQLGDQQTTWAMTQLGTLYAAPEQGASDFGKARALWEISAAAGDPVASCFLSSLHELGLGVPSSRSTALSYAVKAKAQGGCQDIDITLARLK
jgi:hypothetical protein